MSTEDTSTEAAEPISLFTLNEDVNVGGKIHRAGTTLTGAALHSVLANRPTALGPPVTNDPADDSANSNIPTSNTE